MRGLRFIKKPWVIGLFAILLLYQGCSYAFKNSWKSSLPVGVEMGKVLASTSDWIASPGGSCGGAIIELRGKTASKIQHAGLSFFENLEGPQNGSNQITWSQGTSDNRGWISFQCAVKSSSKEKFYEQKLRAALSSQKSFYGVFSRRSKTRILIDPSQRLVFVGYWD